MLSTHIFFIQKFATLWLQIGKIHDNAVAAYFW